MTSPLLVAVDGGNSKTDVVLFGADGGVAAAQRGAGSNPHSLGVDGALDVIGGLIDRARRRTGAGGSDGMAVRAGAFFMAGADQPDEVRRLHEAIARRGWANEVLVGNDTLALLWAGTPAGFGVAVVVGAGVNGVGRAPSGLEAHFGALGTVTGDWGGGEGIGMAALGAAVRGEEGRSPVTALAAMIAAHFGRRTAVEVAVAIHRGEIDAERLAELPPLVFAAVERADPEAIAIVDRQADEVVGFATAALRRTGQDEDVTEVVLGGSVVAAAPARFIDHVRNGVAGVSPRAEVVVWRGRPVVGAAVAVLHLCAADQAAHLRLRAELTADRVVAAGDRR